MKKSIKKNSRNDFGTKEYFIEVAVYLLVAVVAMRITWWFCGLMTDSQAAVGIEISGPQLWLYAIPWSISAIVFIVALAAFAFVLYLVWKDYKRWRKTL